MRYTWEDRKYYFCQKVKKVSDHYGGDDIIWLREYVKELVNKYRDDLETPIRAIEALAPRRRCLSISNGLESYIDHEV